MSETRETVEKLRRELEQAKLSGVPMNNEPPEVTPHALAAGREPVKLKSSSRSRAARVAAAETSPTRLNFDLGQLGISKADQTALASAVQTTRSIIKEYA